MDESKLMEWLIQLPQAARAPLLNADKKLEQPGQARIWLERIFNATLQTWAKEDMLSAETMRGINRWRREGASMKGAWEGVYKKDENGLKKLLREKLYPVPLEVSIETGEGKMKVVRKEEVKLPDFSGDEGKWPELEEGGDMRGLVLMLDFFVACKSIMLSVLLDFAILF
jgi:hypothetical protein